MRTYSNENDFDLHENGRAGETHFHTNGFARRLVLKQRQRVTRKWPIVALFSSLPVGLVNMSGCHTLITLSAPKR